MSSAELDQLLSLVKFRAEVSHVEGLDPFRDLLEEESDGHVLRFLKQNLEKLHGKERGGIAFVIAEHYRKTGDLNSLRKLFAHKDAEVRQYVLNAAWSKADANPQIGPGIIAMAIEATTDPSALVRTEACSVIQNQCGWGLDVSAAVGPLHKLLDDPEYRVRHRAAYAVGNLAKSKYDMSKHIAPLRCNVNHENVYVREASAWALWHLSQHKHDIGEAIPDLVKALTDAEEWDEPRKKAIGALLHYAKKPTENAKQVKECVKSVRLDAKRKEISKFLEQLAKLK